MSYTVYTLEPLGSVGTVASAAAAIAQDPCLVKMANEVLKLQEDMAAADPTVVDVDEGPGVGLCYAITPVQLFRRHIKHPWVVPTFILGFGGLLIYLGYEGGKRRHRRRQ